jgi:hypothetical protein
MKKKELWALIYQKDDYGIVYPFCLIKQTFDGDDLSYVYYPRYDIIDLMPEGLLQGIQGLNLDLRREAYYREGIPSFIRERAPMENREDLQELLAAVGMDYWDPLLYLTKDKHRYWGDDVLVMSFSSQNISLTEKLINKKDAASLRDFLNKLLSNGVVSYEGHVVQAEEKKKIFSSVYPLLKKVAKPEPFVIKEDPAQMEKDFALFYEQYRDKEIPLDEILSLTGTSRATFFRKGKIVKAKGLVK